MITSRIFYHGTDENVFELSDFERLDRKNLCVEMLNYCSDLIEVLYSKKVDDVNGIVVNWIYFYNAFKNESSNYQYDSFYLTTERFKAEASAKIAGVYGEIGAFANNAYMLFLKYCKEYGFEINTELFNQFDPISLNNKNHISKPILIKYTNIPAEILLSENGREVCVNDHFVSSINQNYRIKQNAEFDVKSGEIIRLY